jgi:hypothetical protein
MADAEYAGGPGGQTETVPEVVWSDDNVGVGQHAQVQQMGAAAGGAGSQYRQLTQNVTNNEGLWPEYCNPNYRMPDQIEVKIASSGGDYYFPVTIVKMGAIKPYLGGFRNKNSGHIYHHASSQTPTDTKKAVKDTSNLRTRETQTAEYTTRSVQGYREGGTQMERIDLRLDNKHDNVVYSKTYFSAAQLLLLQKKKTVEIQRCWRGYTARCLARRIRRRNKELDEIEEAEK